MKANDADIQADRRSSPRCSPSSWVGPARFTPPPCKVEELPEIDVVVSSFKYQLEDRAHDMLPQVISHNHYDRTSLPHLILHACTHLGGLADLDTPTLERLVKKQPEQLTIFMPLNTLYALPKILQSKLAVTELDWWESREVVVEQVGGVRITCTPAQHMTARGAFDQMQALWASWAVTGLPGDDDGQEGDKRTSLPAKVS